MLFGMAGPQQLAGLCVQRVHIAQEISGVRGISGSAAGRHRTDAERAADARLGLERPIDTSCPGIERIQVAGVGADEHASRDDRRLTERRDAVRITERPLQRQTRHFVGRQARGFRGLEARIRNVDAPPVPCRTGRDVR